MLKLLTWICNKDIWLFICLTLIVLCLYIYDKYTKDDEDSLLYDGSHKRGVDFIIFMRKDIINNYITTVSRPSLLLLFFLILNLCVFVLIIQSIIVLIFTIYFTIRRLWFLRYGSGVFYVKVKEFADLPRFRDLFLYVFLDYPKYAGANISYFFLKRVKVGNMKHIVLTRFIVWFIGFSYTTIECSLSISVSIHNNFVNRVNLRVGFESFVFEMNSKIICFYSEIRNSVRRQKMIKHGNNVTFNPKSDIIISHSKKLVCANIKGVKHLGVGSEKDSLSGIVTSHKPEHSQVLKINKVSSITTNTLTNPNIIKADVSSVGHIAEATGLNDSTKLNEISKQIITQRTLGIDDGTVIQGYGKKNSYDCNIIYQCIIENNKQYGIDNKDSRLKIFEQHVEAISSLSNEERKSVNSARSLLKRANSTEELIVLTNKIVLTPSTPRSSSISKKDSIKRLTEAIQLANEDKLDSITYVESVEHIIESPTKGGWGGMP